MYTFTLSLSFLFALRYFTSQELRIYKSNLWTDYRPTSYTAAKASHSRPHGVQNLPTHVSHPPWNLSITHVIYGCSMLCFQLLMTPTNHTRGLCCSSQKS